MVFLLILLVLILIIAAKSIKVVKQSEVYIIERLGKFYKVADAGLTIIIPFFDHVRSVVSLKQQTMDVPPQGVITKDNVTITIDTVVFYQITDPAKAVYEIQSLKKGIEYLAITTIRDIVGKMDLDSTFSSRDMINEELRAILDEATDRWGIKVQRVELKNILPPREIQDAMEKQMKADRERREKVIQAEAEKKSQVLVAEGEKESKILRAQADKESQILAAEAEKQSMILRADAVKEQKILEAEGEAQAIDMVQKAIAESIVKLNAANPNEQVIQLKSLEAFAKAADGKATKIIIPSEIQGIAGLATGLKEVMTDVKKPQ